MEKITITGHGNRKDLANALKHFAEAIEDGLNGQYLPAAAELICNIQPLILYRVKLYRDNNALASQRKDGYLLDGLDKSKYYQHERGEAIKKAKAFRGVIEKIK